MTGILQVVTLWATLVGPAEPRVGTLNYTVPPIAGEKYKSADFRLWIPDTHKRIRAIIVRQHGCGRAGLDHADDVMWQALAAKHSAALLGTHYLPGKDCSDWFDPANGSERAFLEALKHFAKKANRAELQYVPWAIWGHSGGSLWAGHMMNRHPDRVVAVWGRSQAVTQYDPKAFDIPVVFNYGVGEKTGQFEKVHTNSVAALAIGDGGKAFWRISVDPKSSHDCRNSRQVAIPFFDKMFDERLSKTDLRKIVVSPWDAKLKKIFDEYEATGEVKDTTPPPAPFKVKVSGNTITWKATADLESGIKFFHIYRDGVKIGRLGGAVAKGNPKGYYQIWNYGDEPEPKPAEMTFTDADGKPGAVYAVSAENHAGLESVKTTITP